MAPPRDRGQRQRDHRDGEGHDLQPDVVGVRRGLVDRVAQPVLAVEEPVADAAEDVGGGGVGGDGPDALRELEDGQPVRALHAEADDPPQRHAQAQHRDPRGRSHDRTDRVASTARVDEEPQGGTDAHEDQRARVDGADGQDHQREQRRVAPAAPAHCPHRQAHQPRQPGPRQEQDGDPGRERELVGREHVDERAGDRPAARDAEHAEQPAGAESGGERDRAEPQALRDPLGHPDVVGEPEERPHREQVADDLVGDGAEPDVRVPEVRGARQQAVGIEVEVLLRVGGDATGRRHQEGHVGEEREGDELEPVVALTALRGRPDGVRRGSVRQLHG